MIRLCALLALVLWGSALAAHETTRSYLALTRSGTEVSATVRIAFRDIEGVIWMDEDLDGTVTWGEAEARLPALSSYLLSVLDLSAGGDCALTRTGTGVSDSGGLAYLDLVLDGRCPSAAAPLQVTSRLFADVDPDHRMYLTVTAGAFQGSAILGAGNPTFTVRAEASGLAEVFLSHLGAGAAHLMGGFDHVVFLLMLMLPAVTAEADRRRALLQLLMAMTGFTLAHAVTLTAASTTLLRPPTDLITLLVAGSIVITALDNIRPFLPGPRKAAAAFFGLIHGFGFATVLGGSALTGGVFLTALLGFNLGIELAQIGVVAVSVFALFAVRGGKALLWSGSCIGGIAGLYWALLAVGVIGKADLP